MQGVASKFPPRNVWKEPNVAAARGGHGLGAGLAIAAADVTRLRPRARYVQTDPRANAKGKR